MDEPKKETAAKTEASQRPTKKASGYDRFMEKLTKQVSQALGLTATLDTCV